MPIRSRALRGALLLAGGLLVTAPDPAVAQAGATVRIEENFRREPNGLILARVAPGTALRVLDSRDNWSQVELQGWVWLPSLQVSDDPDLGLVVAASGGENLRAEPSGRIIGRLVDGALLAELERQPSWARVSRIGWVWSASLDEAPAEDPATAPAQAAPPPAGATPATTTNQPPASEPAARAPGGFIGTRGGAILAAPDGDTLAIARPSSDVEVVRRQGSWARVRLEGWMWIPPTAEGAPDGTVAAEPPIAVEPDEMAAAPEAHAGRVVEWRLQFISLERAEAVRTDFFEGEPFLLTRFGGQDGPFVYVAVPTDRLSEVQGLVPLERIVVTGRVRTAASALTGVPILDLVSLERARGAR